MESMDLSSKDINLSKKFAKISIMVIILYFCIAGLFYFLAGEQLHFRDSRGNIELPIAESATPELTNTTVIEQIFTPKIQILESVSIQWGTYYRQNAGVANISLYDTRNNNLIVEKNVDVSKIQEGSLVDVKLNEPLEGVYDVPILIRITSNSKTGSSVAPLISISVKRENEVLKVNGQEIEGTLCFTAKGRDYIWTGLHYWEFVIAGGLILLTFITVTYVRFKSGKRSYVVNAIYAINKYKFLIRQLVSRDFKTKYKRSILGMFWSFLNPLLMMFVQYFVFSTVFKSDIQNYPAYLLIGIILFNFFSESCGMSLTSILGNASLITKVYMPKYIYPLTRVISSVVNLLISIIPLIMVMIFTGVQFEKSAILSFFFVICLIIFSLGLGLLLSSSMVFFRDTQFLWGVFSTIWMYATPIFYPETILPDEFKFVLQINPLYYMLKNCRMCILDGISPEPIMYFQCFIMAIVMLLIGALVFRKSQDRFVLYL